MATKIVIDADVSSLVSQIDKAAAKFEKFSNAGADSIEKVAANYDKLTEKEKRAFDASKKQFNEKIKTMKALEDEYEELRRKQEQGINLSKDECKRLKDINKEYKTLANATRTISNEMGQFAKNLKKTASSEDKIRTKTPQVIHQFDGLKASVAATVTAITTAASSLALFGADVDKQITKIQAMVNSSEDATQAYYALSDAQAYLGYEADVFAEYSSKLIAVTGSAEKAAQMMRQLGDAAAALGANQQQFDQMVDHIEVMASTDILSDGDIEAIQEIGLLDAKNIVAEAFGVGNYDQIEKVVGTGKKAVDALMRYIDQNYAGAMNTQRDNLSDLATDSMGNLKSVIGEVGKELIDAFGIKDTFRDLKELTGDFLVWFRDIKKEAKENGWLEAFFGEWGAFILEFIAYLGAATAAVKGLIMAAKGFKEVKTAILQITDSLGLFGEADPTKWTTKVANSIIFITGKYYSLKKTFSELYKTPLNDVEKITEKIKYWESLRLTQPDDSRQDYIEDTLEGLKKQRQILIENTKHSKSFVKSFRKLPTILQNILLGLKNITVGAVLFAAKIIATYSVFIVLAELIGSTIDSYDKFEKKHFKSLYDRASAGEAPLDSEDGTDVVVQAERELELREDIVKAEQEALKMSKANIASTDEFAKQRKKILEEEKTNKVNEASIKDYKKEFLAAEQEIARYRLAISEKTEKAKLDNAIKRLSNLQNLYASSGAAEYAHEQQKQIRLKSLEADLMTTKQNYAAQELALNQQKAIKELELAKATNEQEKQLARNRIAFIDEQIKNLKNAHSGDDFQIKVTSNIEQLDSDLSRAKNKINETKVNPKYEQNLANTLSSYHKNATALSEAKATGGDEGMASMMSIGQLLGMTTEEILAKGSAIEQVYSTISKALVDSAAKETAANESAYDSAKKLADFRQNYMNSLATGFGDMFADWATGAKTAKEAFGDFARGIIQEVVAMIAKLTALYLLMLACGYGGKAFANAKFLTFGSGSWQGKAKGGYITGPGTSRSDSIPAMLSNGEYVLNAAAVNAIGVHRLDQMNKGYVPRFADGGLVGKSNASQPVVSPTVNLTVSALDASSFDNFLRRGGLDKIKQAFYSDNLKFAANAGVF